MATKPLKLTDLDKKEAKSRTKESLIRIIAGAALLLSYAGLAGLLLLYYLKCGL